MKTNSSSETVVFLAGVLMLAAVIVTYFYWKSWDSELNAETERVMRSVNSYYKDQSGKRVYYKVVRDGSVWLTETERASRKERPNLLGR